MSSFLLKAILSDRPQKVLHAVACDRPFSLTTGSSCDPLAMNSRVGRLQEL